MRRILPRTIIPLVGSLLLASLFGCAQQPIHPDTQESTPKPTADKAATAAQTTVALPPDAITVAQIPVGNCNESNDIWVRIRKGYALPDKDNPGVEPDQLWFARHPEYLTRVAERATPYIHYIVDDLQKRHMPLELALLPIVESAYQPFAYSNGRAAGLWQFIPGTGHRFGLRQNWWYDGRRDVVMATDAALDYLQQLHDMFNGDWLLALAAYNSGEGTVQRAIAHNQKKGLPTDFWSLDLPRETRGYVPKLLAISNIVANPPANGVLIPTIPDEPFLAHVKVGSQIDLALAAQLAGISVEEIYRYNPAYNRWATDPDGPHELLLPIEKVAQFEEGLKKYPESQRITWQRHTVEHGETLSTIAHHYRTTTSVLKSVNKLPRNIIRVGQGLLIPVARGNEDHYALSEEQRREQIQNTPRGGKKVEYVVKNGDTLWSIARKHDVSTSALAKWNGMATRDALKEGMTLVVWHQKKVNGFERVSAVAATEFEHPIPASTHQRIGYKVRRGDTLSRISQRFRVRVDDIKRWNKLHSGKLLHPGQQLTLYVDVTAQSGRI